MLRALLFAILLNQTQGEGCSMIRNCQRSRKGSRGEEGFEFTGRGHF